MVPQGSIEFQLVINVPKGSEGFQRVLMGCNGFYWESMVFNMFLWVPKGYIKFQLVIKVLEGSKGLKGFHWGPIGSTVFQWLMMGINGF